MNLYALLPLVAFFANAFLGYFILYSNPREKLNRLYALSAFATATWALGDFFVFLSPTPEAGLYCDKISTVGSSLTAAFLLHFFLIFTKSRFIQRRIYLIFLYLPTIIFIFINFATNLITESTEKAWWGYSLISGILYVPFVAYIIVYIIVGLLFCYRFNSKTKSAREKAQSKLLIIAISIPLVGGILTEAIPISIGFSMIPLTSTLSTITAAIIAHSMIKYKLMTITPSMAAGNIIETMADYIVAVDNNNDISFVNKPGLEALGYTKEEIVNKPFSVIFAEKEIFEFQVFKELKYKHYLRNYETEVLTKDKKRIPTSINASVITDKLNKAIGFVFVIRDITESKRAEEEIKKTMEELERSNAELDKFAFIVSHDLKAPLRAVSQLAAWISEDYADAIDKDGKEKMNLLIGRVKRMDNLIGGILEYSRAGRMKEEAEEIDLNSIAEESIESVAPPDNIRVTIENELPVVMAERFRIEQVFQNLISNAVKFMDKPKGEIKIGCVDENSHWKISIADNGPGIDEKFHDKIFQVFQTIEPRDKCESTGIGLSVVKKIIELYGGKIWVESKVGEGSTFHFTLAK